MTKNLINIGNTITLAQLNSDAGNLIAAVQHKGDVYVVTRYGKPVAALVPISMLESRALGYRRLGETLERIAQGAATMAEAEIERLVAAEPVLAQTAQGSSAGSAK